MLIGHFETCYVFNAKIGMQDIFHKMATILRTIFITFYIFCQHFNLLSGDTDSIGLDKLSQKWTDTSSFMLACGCQDKIYLKHMALIWVVGTGAN